MTNERAAGTVKALEWETNGIKWWVRGDAPRYEVGVQMAWGCKLRFGDVLIGSSSGDWFRSQEEAKAAAQADHERRILSALTASASEPSKPIVWATGKAKEAGWKLDLDFLDKIASAAEAETGYAVTCEVVEYVFLAGHTYASPVPASESEPVAWQRYGKRTGWTAVDPDFAKQLAEGGELVRPLYTKFAPVPDAVEALRECVAYIASPLRMSRDEDEAKRRDGIVERARRALILTARPDGVSARKGNEERQKANIETLVIPSDRERQSNGVANTDGQPVGEPVVEPSQHETNLAPAENGVAENSARHFPDGVSAQGTGQEGGAE